MFCVEGADAEDTEAKFAAEIVGRCHAAFAADCRLAVKWAQCPDGCHIVYDFVALGAGEKARPGWTIYENRGGIPIGRSA